MWVHQSDDPPTECGNVNSKVYIIRHAEKGPNTVVVKDRDIQLTAKGKAAARSFGKRLVSDHNLLNIIRTSPFSRCTQTASGIVEGVGADCEIDRSTILGDPGPFVTDDVLAADVFKSAQVLDIVKQQLQGVCFPGMRKTDDGVRMILDMLKSDLTRSGCSLYVTHDSILAVFAGFITKEPISQDNWFDYLEGICLTKTSCDSYFLYWNSAKIDVTKWLQENGT